MSNGNYRSFIILRQDCRGYAISSKEPFGYCKIDAYGDKARFQLYVQELKIIPKEKGYRFTLLANLPAGPKQIPLDSFYVDEKGKRNFKIEMDRNNIGGSGLKVEQIEGVAVLAEDSFSNTVAPLIGFKREPFEWNPKKMRTKFEKEEKMKENNKEEKQAIKERKELKETTTDEKERKEEIKKKEMERSDIEKATEKLKEIKGEDIYKEEKQEERKEENIIEKAVSEENDETKEIRLFESEKERKEDFTEIFEFKNEELEEKKPDKEERKSDQDKEESAQIETEDQFFTGQTYWNFFDKRSKEEDYINKIIERSIRMNPFEKPGEDMEWYRISYEELPLIVNFPWRWYSNPFLLVGAKKYNHILLGKNKKLNTYCLGIPDLYSQYSKERAESFGYRTFLCCRNTQPVTGEYGYWIIDLVMNV